MAELNGRTILVTGATSGIGFQTALALAEQGAQVVLGARTEPRGRAAVQRIRNAQPEAGVDYLVGDLSSMQAVRELAEAFSQRYSALHVLVNNAGGYFLRRELSVDGYEMTFALNHLSYFLLTNLLLDTLRSSAPARVVNVASVAHRDARIHFDDLQLEHNYGVGLRAYGQSKLANVLFTYELHRRLAGTGVSTNALHPGFVRTGLPVKHIMWPLRLFVWLSFLFGMPPDRGATSSIRLASDPSLAEVSGNYYSRGRQVRSSPRSYDEQTARRLWQISEQLTGLRPGAG